VFKKKHWVFVKSFTAIKLQVFISVHTVYFNIHPVLRK